MIRKTLSLTLVLLSLSGAQAPSHGLDIITGQPILHHIEWLRELSATTYRTGSEHPLNREGYRLVASYPMRLPRELTADFQYDAYPMHQHYAVARQAVNIRSGPGTQHPIIGRVWAYQKVIVHELVHGQLNREGDSDLWYRVVHGGVEGYLFAGLVEKRTFRFDGMVERAERLRRFVKDHEMAAIDNYKNRNGYPPPNRGRNEDDRGILRSQSAPAYLSPDTESEMQYLEDGRLVAVLADHGDYVEVLSYDDKRTYFVPAQYIDRKHPLEVLDQVAIVDIAQQNQVVLSHEEGRWRLLSMTYATTGADTEYKEPTVPGHYKVIETRSKFLYLDDITEEIAGYAPYATRFNGGAYIHGVPVNFQLIEETRILTPALLDEEGKVIRPAVTEKVVVDRVDPGMAENLSTLGTDPRSHKCVRNATSHAKWLYDWVKIGRSAVIAFED